jgi:uncharacterized protein
MGERFQVLLVSFVAPNWTSTAGQFLRRPTSLLSARRFRPVYHSVMSTKLDIDLEKLAKFCRANGILRLRLFGSTLHGANRPDSDLDLLVEFEPERRIGYFGLAGLEIELSELTGSRVDLRSPQELSKYFRQQVLDEAEVLYDAA